MTQETEDRSSNRRAPYRLLRIWAFATVTVAFVGGAIRLGWAFDSGPMPADAWTLVALIALAVLNTYALVVFVIVTPPHRLRAARFFKIWVTVTIVAALAAAVTHLLRFLPSSQCVWPISVIVAFLLLAASFSAGLLVMWFIWFVLRAEDRDRR